MKRRDFIKASVGAGVVVSTPLAGSHGVFVPLRPQEGRTLYDKIWDSHVVANLSGDTDLLAIDRNIMADGGAGSVHSILEEGLTIASPELNWPCPTTWFPPHRTDMRTARSTQESLGRSSSSMLRS